MNLPDVLKPQDCANHLKVGTYAIKNAIKNGELKAMKLSNKTYRIDKPDFIAYKEWLKCQKSTEVSKSNPEKSVELGKSENMSKESGNDTQQALAALRKLTNGSMLSKRKSAEIAPLKRRSA